MYVMLYVTIKLYKEIVRRQQHLFMSNDEHTYWGHKTLTFDPNEAASLGSERSGLCKKLPLAWMVTFKIWLYDVIPY